MHADNNKTAALEAALLVLLGFLWGIPYALNKVSLATIPPMTGVAARVSLAAIALWIIVFMLKCKMPSRRDFIPRVFVQGLIGCLVPYTFIAFAQQSVDSSLAAILNSTTPLFVCLISLAWTRHEPLTFGRLFGVSIGSGWCHHDRRRRCTTWSWPIRHRSSGGYFGQCGIRCQRHSRPSVYGCCAGDYSGWNADIHRGHTCPAMFCR